MWQVWDKVVWRQEHRGGYGYITPVAAVVIRPGEVRTRIAVHELASGEIVERSVKTDSLRPRTLPCPALDDAFAE